jgi:GYF domain 2
MATYTIIGGDQKEYGSVTSDDLRKWITDGRLNAQSLAKEENDTEWRPLSAFPEFADVLATGSAPPPPLAAPMAGAGGGRDAALQLVKGPAIGLKVTAILGLVMVVVGLVVNVMTLNGFHIGPQQMYDPQMQKLIGTLGGSLGIIQNIIGGIVGVAVLLGAAKMQKLQHYQFALIASIMAMVPCISPCCLFGLPLGIWALVVLNKPEVKSHFG